LPAATACKEGALRTEACGSTKGLRSFGGEPLFDRVTDTDEDDPTQTSAAFSPSPELPLDSLLLLDLCFDSILSCAASLGVSACRPSSTVVPDCGEMLATRPRLHEPV